MAEKFPKLKSLKVDLSYFDPDELSAQMRAMGYAQTRVLAAGEANELYFKGRADGFRVRGSGRIMAARV